MSEKLSEQEVALTEEVKEEPVCEVCGQNPCVCEDKDGNLFWNESRRMPHPITYNSNDEISFLFIKSI